MRIQRSMLALAACSALLVVTLPACAGPREKSKETTKGAAAAPAPAASDDAVVARVAGKDIRMSEIQKLVGGRLRELENQAYEMKSQAIDQIVADTLVEAEAKKQGITSDELIKKEVTDKIAAVTDDEVKKFYEDNKARIQPGQTLEMLAPQIKNYLQQQQEGKLRADFIEGLKKGQKIEVLLEPIRVPVTAGNGHAKGGGPDAPVLLVEFSEFQCPFCSRVGDTLKQIETTYGKNVRIVFRDFPLEFHPNAQKAAEAARCAGEQGKFWEMHDALFANQKELAVENLKQRAKDLGLDTAKFDQCLDSGKMAEAVKADLEAGKTWGVTGTPAFFVNGRFIGGARPFEQFKSVIDDELRRKGIEPPAAPAS